MHKTSTVITYVLAAVACSLFMLGRNLEAGDKWLGLLLVWLLLCAVPLLFVFAYPRFLFAVSSEQTNRRRYSALLHGVAIVTAAVLFTAWSPFWKNPARDLRDSIFAVLVVLAVLVVFFVASIFLLLKNRSTFAALASVLFWPYWLLLALTFEGRWFQDTGIHAAYYFLCFVTPVLFAFAAGAVSHRSALSHSFALAGLVSAPWLYLNAMRDSGLGNVWLIFNVPDNELKMYPPLQAGLTIFSVGLITLAVSTAALRLLPSRWRIRKSTLCTWTWPAFAAAFGVLAVWFSQSVMPYRIPGAVDYSDWPILQILHVEKRGLQFHETCVKAWGRRDRPISVSFSGNDRRLFQYRFLQKYARGEPPEALAERIRAIIESSGSKKGSWETVKPIRSWNADGWYFKTEDSGLKVYGTPNGSAPPPEIVDLFHELERVPRSSETQSESRDVCFGFCYDPLSGMGLLYANHRCFNDDNGVVCR